MKTEEHKRSEGATARDVSVAPSVFRGDIKSSGSGLDPQMKSPSLTGRSSVRLDLFVHDRGVVRGNDVGDAIAADRRQ